MTPKEKAEDLFVKYYERLPDDTYSNEGAKSEAKECALIVVDEIMEFMKMDDEYTETSSNANSKWVYFWEQVKQEIQNG